MDVLVFGGTSEGRQLVEWLSARGSCNVVACSATEYGASLVAQGARVEALQGPLSHEQKQDLMRTHDFCCIVDATHPFAQHISSSIDELGRTWQVDVVRVERARAEDECSDEEPWEGVPSVAEAARRVAGLPGNILLTTGTKDLAVFTKAIPDFAERLYVRILPVQASLARVEEQGIPPSHVVAMQGPFSAQLNAALIRELNIACLVTKESGQAGGFAQKVRAARECGTRLVVVRRPPAREGVSIARAKALLEERYGI